MSNQDKQFNFFKYKIEFKVIRFFYKDWSLAHFTLEQFRFPTLLSLLFIIIADYFVLALYINIHFMSGLHQLH